MPKHFQLFQDVVQTVSESPSLTVPAEAPLSSLWRSALILQPQAAGTPSSSSSLVQPWLQCTQLPRCARTAVPRARANYPGQTLAQGQLILPLFEFNTGLFQPGPFETSSNVFFLFTCSFLMTIIIFGRGLTEPLELEAIRR